MCIKQIDTSYFNIFKNGFLKVLIYSMLGQNLNVFLMIDLTNNMELGIINTAKEKSSPFMQFCLQILTTYPKTPLSSLERLSLTMEMDITLPPVNSLPM